MNYVIINTFNSHTHTNSTPNTTSIFFNTLYSYYYYTQIHLVLHIFSILIAIYLLYNYFYTSNRSGFCKYNRTDPIPKIAIREPVTRHKVAGSPRPKERKAIL